MLPSARTTGPEWGINPFIPKYYDVREVFDQMGAFESVQSQILLCERSTKPIKRTNSFSPKYYYVREVLGEKGGLILLSERTIGADRAIKLALLPFPYIFPTVSNTIPII